jgi:two-component system chemotaxis response regulator CheB
MPVEPGLVDCSLQPGFGVVALAASAGGLEALMEILNGLPVDFPASVLVAQHRSAALPDLLAHVLGRRTPLRVKTAEEGEVPKPGVVYTSPAGRHLELGTFGQLHVWRAVRVRFVRPSADLLFESLARTHGGRAVAVVLTGMGDDGARGVRAVRRAGGFVIAQDEDTAPYPDMPLAAVATAAVDLVLPLCRVAFALTALVMGAEAAIARHPAPPLVGRQLRAHRLGA